MNDLERVTRALDDQLVVAAVRKELPPPPSATAWHFEFVRDPSTGLISSVVATPVPLS